MRKMLTFVPLFSKLPKCAHMTIKIYIVTDKLIEISFYNSCFQKNILVEFCCQHLQCVEIYDKDTKKSAHNNLLY